MGERAGERRSRAVERNGYDAMTASARASDTNASDCDSHALIERWRADPFAALGAHPAGPGAWHVRVMAPHARAVRLLAIGDDSELAVMRRVHDIGLFTATIDAAQKPDYRLCIESEGGVQVMHDPYSFGVLLDDDALRAIRGEGAREACDVLGAHPMELGRIAGVRFAVWAPNARRVSVVGPFNGWDGRVHAMRLRHDGGVWELFVPGLVTGLLYKYEIAGPDGGLEPLKADPFAFAAEQPPATASVIAPTPQRQERRALERDDRPARERPISIYECHLGSWARVPDEGNRYLTYREMAERLLPYVEQMGFTHIELLPITEFPFDGSWGYQPISLFAPTSRFGSPEDFSYFVDEAHRRGLHVLLDWVPAHFPNDAHGLASFDGTHLYEHADPRQGFHQDWGTYIYNYGRKEVEAFLVSNARFWLERYGLDGLRVDAVASMLYLDYSRKAGEWVPNRHGGNENLEAIDFLRRMNEVAYSAAPDAITVAEESTAWPGVSRPTWAGGLGFGFKWNMGWMHDTLRYMSRDPIHRRHHHDDLTFGLLYGFTENFILPLSHDEVVHGKGSLFGKMPGDHWQRFANLRAYYGFMWGHPGKKLLFMGGEFAQEREWNHDVSLDWHLLDNPMHRGVQDLVRDLNGAYSRTPALHQRDCEADGFCWLVAEDRDNSVLAFARFNKDRSSIVIVVCNFTPIVRHDYRVGAPRGGFWREIVNTDADVYGGGNVGNSGGLDALDEPGHGQSHSLCMTLPPLATIMFEWQG
ncbi:MAG: 1,4-alpha-glucan branching protein GlgB [Beijerinckiaceae bacterium]|nr:1,4-alpha-glucan branching protein GlgB [Beijerinckiaceae bacterium]